MGSISLKRMHFYVLERTSNGVGMTSTDAWDGKWRGRAIIDAYLDLDIGSVRRNDGIAGRRFQFGYVEFWVASVISIFHQKYFRAWWYYFNQWHACLWSRSFCPQCWPSDVKTMHGNILSAHAMRWNGWYHTDDAGIDGFRRDSVGCARRRVWPHSITELEPWIGAACTTVN